MSRISILLAISCVLGCLVTSNELWEIVFKEKLSEKSRFYVLHDWSDSVYGDANSAPFPASQISDIMLKTMGIWKDGVNWPGVKLGNLFSRPRATALFILDGLSDHIDIEQLSEQEYSVNGGPLNGNIEEDTNLMFHGDSIMNHLYQLFDGKSLSLLISGKDEGAESIKSETSSIFDLTSLDDIRFLGELAIMRNTVLKLSTESVEDGNPDVMVFSFTTLKALENKYGSDSKQLAVAIKMVTDTIKEVTNALVDVYDGDIVVQAVVLQWSYTDKPTAEIEHLLSKHFTLEKAAVMTSQLPSLSLPEMDYDDKLSLCADLAYIVESKGGVLKAQCTVERDRLRRQASDVDNQDNPVNNFPIPNNIVADRSEDFPAVFLMVFVTVVPLALALYAISWAMWNMDPGKDSVIYRNTDMQGIKLH